MAKNRIPIWPALIVGAIGLPLAAILGLWTYKSVTTPILHADPQQVRSVTYSHPSRKWTDAAERGRQIMRAGLIQQNLPGLSVAVGVDGDIVWAEGFGWANLENQVPVAPDTGFRVADPSKALTSAAVGLLLEKNTLHLDDEIQMHVPEFPKKQWPVTLRQLMAQVAGVPSDHGGEALCPMPAVAMETRLRAARGRSTGCSWTTSGSVSCNSRRARSTALRATVGSS